MRHLLLVGLVAVIVVTASLVFGDMTSYQKRTGKKFLDKVLAEDDQIVKLPSGMLVKVLKKGDSSDSPKVDTDCDVHYTGTLKDGTKFDSSVDRGQPATFKPNQVIKGWTEALQLMAVGDKWKLYIPYDIAYGAHGSPPKIPGYAPLVFEVELMKINGAGKAASEARAEFEKKGGRSYDSITV